MYGSCPTDNGPKTLTFDAPGEAAEFLREVGYVVQVVVTRPDGGSITDNERPIVAAAIEAELRGEGARDAAARVHFAQAGARLDAMAEPVRKAG